MHPEETIQGELRWAPVAGHVALPWRTWPDLSKSEARAVAAASRKAGYRVVVEEE